MKNLRPFEIILVTAFGLVALLALILLATYRPASQTVNPLFAAPVVIWGTLSASAFDEVLRPPLRTGCNLPADSIHPA